MQYVFFGLPRNALENSYSIQSALMSNFPPTKITKSYSPDKKISNKRSGEVGYVNNADFRQFDGDLILLTDDDLWEIDNFIIHAKKHVSDPWADDFKSFGNLLKQLKCIENSRKYICVDQPVMFVRPDTMWDNLAESSVRKLRYLVDAKSDFIVTPRWQSWRGVNDRFALTCGGGTAAFTQRYDLLTKDARQLNDFINGEFLLYNSISQVGDLEHYTIKERFYRTRLGGKRHPERFDILTSRSWDSFFYNFRKYIGWKFL
jgi:hypothetical protein